MNLIDRSPGGFIVVASLAVYVTVLIATWMLTTANAMAMVFMLVLIVGLACALCDLVMRLTGSEAYTSGEETPVAASAPRGERYHQVVGQLRATVAAVGPARETPTARTSGRQ